MKTPIIYGVFVYLVYLDPHSIHCLTETSPHYEVVLAGACS